MNWYKKANINNKQIEAVSWREIKNLIMMGAVGSIIAAPLAITMISNALQMPPQQVKQQLQSNPQQVVQKLEQVVPNEPAVQQQPLQPNSTAPQSQRLNIGELMKFIEQEEGRRTHVYNDTKGIATIGVGFNLLRKDARQRLKTVGADYDRIISGKTSLTNEQIDALFQYDVQTSLQSAKTFLPNFDSYPVNVQMAITDMAFNLGEPKLSKFNTTRKLLMDRNFAAAAARLRQVPWYSDHPKRSERVIRLIESAQ